VTLKTERLVGLAISLPHHLPISLTRLTLSETPRINLKAAPPGELIELRDQVAAAVLAKGRVQAESPRHVFHPLPSSIHVNENQLFFEKHV